MRDAGVEDARLAALIRRGEHLAAYDLAYRRIERDGVSPAIAHAAVICLARSGATDFARLEYARWRLGGDPDDAEAATLGARLLKDVALASSGARRRAFARASALRYAASDARHGGLYSAINVATMSLIAGDRDRARQAAEKVLSSTVVEGDATESYYALASRAEAQVLLGAPEAAAETLAQAIARSPQDYTAHASTLGQIDIILQELGAPNTWLAPLRPPRVAHFTGRIFNLPESRDQPTDPSARRTEALAAEMQGVLRTNRVGFAYGGLAAGADILWAEALVACGAELHVVLPTSVGSFVANSVAPFGQGWVRRFEACLACAQSVRLATKDPYAGDDQVFTYSSQFAIGCAILRAEALATEAVQLAVSGGDAQSNVAADLAYWAAAPRRQVILTLDRAPLRVAPRAQTAHPPTVMKAMLFVDVRGFGSLRDDQIPAFFGVVMAQIAQAVATLARKPEHIETWGDGVFLVFDQPADAAEAALAILAAHRRLNLRARGLPRWLALRIGGHYGPVHLLMNPILGNQAVVGSHVVVAARIEPNVAPGSVYVSEAFAGALATFHADRFRCGYVGRTKARRDFEPLSIFNVVRRECPDMRSCAR